MKVGPDEVDVLLAIDLTELLPGPLPLLGVDVGQANLSQSCNSNPNFLTSNYSSGGLCLTWS